MTIGQNIKRLRKNADMTQEELAEMLSISSQAVSRWETDSAMPDISIIPALVNIFEVTSDELLGIDAMKLEKKIEKIIEDASAPQRLNYETEEEQLQVSIKEYETYIDALKSYPKSIPLLDAALGSGFNLAVDLARNGNQERAAELYRACIRQGNIILNSCTDITRLMDTHRWMVWTYLAMGDFTKAEEHADKMPKRFSNTSGMMKAYIKSSLGDIDGEIQQCCNNLSEILSVFEEIILHLGKAYRFKGQYENAICVYKSLYDLIPVIYDNEEYTPPYHTLSVGEYIALCYVKLGQYDEAVEWLWKDFEHLSKNAKHYNKCEHLGTPLLRECTFRFFGESMRIKEHMDYLERPEFKVLHDHPGYKELLVKLADMD